MRITESEANKSDSFIANMYVFCCWTCQHLTFFARAYVPRPDAKLLDEFNFIEPLHVFERYLVS